MTLFKKNMIELLAPAKDLACGKMAITCGADAVYVGATHFSARAAAHNNLTDIAELIDFAHLYAAKVYVALNTMLTDAELVQAEKLIVELYRLGADALIIQDPKLLHLDLPPIALIASTQMNNRTTEKVLLLEELGFKRAILARELSLSQIQEIASAVKQIELECFIHGALCVCYSGQCNFSEALGGRSGNRGDCAQPCRKEYSLVDNENNVIYDKKHLLSLKDLNLSEYLEELILAGITSFKIEGRLKDIFYVQNTVSFYRQKLDLVLAKLNLKKSSLGTSKISFTPDPAKTFNRGFTSYFLKNRPLNLANFYTPKAQGEFIGYVEQVTKSFFSLDQPHDLTNGDGICFLYQEQLSGTNINKVENGRIYAQNLNDIQKGTAVFRNHNAAFLRELKHARIERKIAVDFVLNYQVEELLLTATCADGVTASATVALSYAKTQDQQANLAVIIEQLHKLGQTIFECVNLKLDIPADLFVPASIIKTLRQEISAKLLAARQSLNLISTQLATKPATQLINKLPFPPKTPLMTTKYCLKFEAGLCVKQQAKVINTGVEPLFLVDDKGRKYRLEFDCQLCEMTVLKL